MNILHSVAHLDEEASGPSYSVPSLTESLAKLCNNVTLVSLDRGKKIVYPPKGVNYLSFKQEKNLKKLGRSKIMKRWFNNLKENDFQIIHSHGLWMMPNIYPDRYCTKNNLIHIIAPRGTLNPEALNFSKYKKFLMWNLYQKKVLNNARAFHATSKDEASNIRKLGFKQPIIISKNGVNIPEKRKKIIKRKKTLLFLSRIHQKKGVDVLLDAWNSVEKNFPNWNLKIVGKGESRYLEILKKKIQSKMINRVDLQREAYGSDKLKIFRESDLFILPTQGENFGMAIAEAMACELPIITTLGAPWPDIEKKECGWRVELNVQEIINILNYALNCEQNRLLKMGLNCRRWMIESYNWEKIAHGLNNSYLNLIKNNFADNNIQLY